MNFYKDVAPTVETKDGDKVNVNDIVVNSKVIPELVDNGSKNLLQLTPRVVESNDITFTINNDGTITASGTKTDNSISYIIIGTIPDEFMDGNHILSGCPLGGSVDGLTYCMYANNADVVFMDYGFGVLLNKSNKSNFSLVCRISSSGTWNLTFKPMICSKAAWDVSHDFVPYAMSNVELTEKKQDVCSANVYTGSLNDLIFNGFYYYNDSATDTPVSNSNGFCRVSVHNSATILQEVFIDHGSTDYCDSFVRVKYNSIWRAWRKITP